jgi:hypothetical protein
MSDETLDQALERLFNYLIDQRDAFFKRCPLDHPPHDDERSCELCVQSRECACVWCGLADRCEDAISALRAW